MTFRRLRSLASGLAHQGEPVEHGGESGDAVLARWLAAAEYARQDETGRELWQLTSSPIYAALWYEARAAGERLRARAVAHLYATRPQPGGRYPDPREPATFSARAIATTATRLLGLTPMTYPLSAEEEQQEALDQMDHKPTPLAWLVTYPPSPHSGPIAPELWLHPATTHHPLGTILFELACLLGYITKEHGLLDPDAPHGVTTLPRVPGILPVMHQFAIALLCLDPRCPPEWGCACNTVRTRFTSPPVDHDQPTETLSMADLAREARDSQPRRTQGQAREQTGRR